jgi:hypothetical protein
MRHWLIPFIIPAIGAALLVAWGAAGAPAATPAQRPAPRCFLAAQVNGFTPRGRDAVDVRVSASRIYRLTLGGVCPDVDWSIRLGLRSRGGGSWICQGADAEIITRGPTGPETCLVTDVHALSPDEIAASRHRRH